MPKRVTQHEFAIALAAFAVLAVISALAVAASRRAPEVTYKTGVDPHRPMPASEFSRPVPKE